MSPIKKGTKGQHWAAGNHIVEPLAVVVIATNRPRVLPALMRPPGHRLLLWQQVPGLFDLGLPGVGKSAVYQAQQRDAIEHQEKGGQRRLRHGRSSAQNWNLHKQHANGSESR